MSYGSETTFVDTETEYRIRVQNDTSMDNYTLVLAYSPDWSESTVDADVQKIINAIDATSGLTFVNAQKLYGARRDITVTP